MTYRILQYIQPWEIDDLERQIHTMILGSYYIKDPKKIIWTLNMNTDCIDWIESKLPESYFIDKLNYLSNLVHKYFTADFRIDNSIKGAMDIKRTALDSKQDFVIWLDSDIFFSYLTLPNIVSATELLNDEAYILTPQIIKYWDNSWDVIVHEKFLNYPYNHRDTFDLYSLNDLVTKNECSIKSNYNIKLGAGWFNLISDQVIKKIPFPTELGSYGPDDTYLALCATKLKIPQYILQGVVVSEIGNSFLEKKDYLKKQLKSKIQDKQKVSDQDFYNLVKKFYESN
jgi:hypothetical protein